MKGARKVLREGEKMSNLWRAYCCLMNILEIFVENEKRKLQIGMFQYLPKTACNVVWRKNKLKLNVNCSYCCWCLQGIFSGTWNQLTRTWARCLYFLVDQNTTRHVCKMFPFFLSRRNNYGSADFCEWKGVGESGAREPDGMLRVTWGWLTYQKTYDRYKTIYIKDLLFRRGKVWV